MRKLGGSIGAAALALALMPAAHASQGSKPARPSRVYGPAPPPAPRVYGPQPAPPAAKPGGAPAARTPSDIVARVATSAESTKPGTRGAATGAVAKGARLEVGRGEEKQRPVTIYFVHGQEKQSIVEFLLPAGESQAGGAPLPRAMTFEAGRIEADVDGKMLLRGDVRIRFANGMRLGAQLVAVSVGRDEGAVEIVVKE